MSRRHLVSLVLGLIVSGAASAEMLRPAHLVEVLKYVPSRVELARLQTAGVEFLFLSLPGYPDRFQARDLATFTGKLTMLIQTASAPDSFQVMALNLIKSPVYLMLTGYPDSFAVRRLGELQGDVYAYVFANHLPSSMDVRNLNDINSPLTVVASANYPDSFHAARLAEIESGVRVVLNTPSFPDSYSVRTLNTIERPMRLYIDRAVTPGSTFEAQHLAQLDANYSVIMGRTYTAASVLEKMLIALDPERRR
jgi:hypothetical protein